MANMITSIVRPARITVAAVAAAGLALVGCASGGTTTSSTSTLTFAVFNPFSGGEAAFGPEKMAGCLTAIHMIEAAGGILQHKGVQCVGFDDRDDPVDAIPAAEKMLATTSNLVGVVGPTSDAGTATAPIINRAKVTMFSDSGERTFDHSHYTYFWRIVPPDEDAGLAMALWAHKKGYTRVAAVFGNDISEQGNVPALIHGFEHLGGKISIDQQVALDSSSYRSEVEQMLASHPQAIFTEMDPQSAATYFSELHQLHSMLPIIGTAGTEGPSWWKAVSLAIGKQNMVKYYVGVQPYVPTGTPAWRIYHASLMAVAGKIKNAAQYIADPYAMAVYDSVNIMALAMTAAHSTNPTTYNSFVPKVVSHSPGAVVVDNYQAGKQALAAGKTIDYVGTTGRIEFDPWHNSPGAFEVNTINPANFNDVPLVTSFTAAQIAALAKASGL